ncbi:YrzI family small protein [Bacillus pumilus]|uniref:YrzI family small protein n=1 Tax=Bacillus pumilus TaxID=1408 RepID=A0AAD0HLL2_BACPU|nr:YrzI family small protein [Bacillus pumilus]AVM23510.1 hypothetical protein C5695_06595 [Bacillus pumilus]TYS44876.1 YrzI family small protein [Bacillus pumilus]
MKIHLFFITLTCKQKYKDMENVVKEYSDVKGTIKSLI